jgi:hypothetical protein
MMKARVIGLTRQHVMQNLPRLGEEPRLRGLVFLTDGL